MDHKEQIFSELNQHIRNTENKYLSISLSYLGLLAIIISIIFNENQTFLTPKPISIAIYTIICFIGCVVYILQKWYRMWKEHYLEVCNSIASTWGIEEKFLPFWLRKNMGEVKFCIDHTLGYFTAFINFCMFLLLAYNLSLTISSRLWQVLAPIFTFSCFIIFLFIVNNTIKKDWKQVA